LVSSTSSVFIQLAWLGAYAAFAAVAFAAVGWPAEPHLLLAAVAPLGVAAPLVARGVLRLLRLKRCAKKILKEGLSAVPCVPGAVVAERHSSLSRRIKSPAAVFVRAGEPAPGQPAFPGCGVEEGPCRGLLVVLADLNYSLRGSVAASSKWGDWARAELEPAGPGQVRVKMECRLERAKAAKLRLASLEITCADSGSHEYVADLRGSEWPALFIMTRETPWPLFLGKVGERDPCRDGCRMILTLELPKGKVEEVGKAELVVQQGGGAPQGPAA